MAKYLDPKVDFLFKKIFGENKELLKSFLNSLLPLKEGQEIITIEYLSPEQVPGTPLGKNSIVDVKCIDNYERSFVVEMQSEWSNIFRKRLLVNGSKAVVRQMNKKIIEDDAKKFQDLKPVYVLAVVNSKFTTGNNWYHNLHIMDPKEPTVVIEGLSYILLELPNFTPDKWTSEYKKIAILWLRFLKEIEGYYERLPEEFASNKFIYSAIKICEESALSPSEREAYEHDKEQAQWDHSIKGLEDEVAESRKMIAEKNNTIAEKDKAIAEKDKAIEEKDKAIEEKDKALQKALAEIDEIKKNRMNTTMI
jgi:predicted transposase/invertase (TIGR01784 family)